MVFIWEPDGTSTDVLEARYILSAIICPNTRAGGLRRALHQPREAGLEPFMAADIAEKHYWMAEQARQPEWQFFADGLFNARGKG